MRTCACCAWLHLLLLLGVDVSDAKNADVAAASAEDADECSNQLAGEVEDTDDVGDGIFLSGGLKLGIILS